MLVSSSEVFPHLLTKQLYYHVLLKVFNYEHRCMYIQSKDLDMYLHLRKVNEYD